MVTAEYRLQDGQHLVMRDDAAAAELLRRIRARLTAEVQRLQQEVSASGARGQSASDGNHVAPASRDHRPMASARSRLSLMRELERALDGAVPDDLHGEWAGPGSMVVLEDAASGERQEFLLMPEDGTAPAAGQLSLDSAIGEAVRGKGVGASVAVILPTGVRTFRIRALTTLRALVGVNGRDLDAAGGWGGPATGGA